MTHITEYSDKISVINCNCFKTIIPNSYYTMCARNDLVHDKDTMFDKKDHDQNTDIHIR